MDYVLPNEPDMNSASAQPFFTTGAGVNDPNQNSFEAENNLDLSNNATTWQNNIPEHDTRVIGNRAIFSADTVGNAGALAAPKQPQADISNPPLGQIVELTSRTPVAGPSVPTMIRAEGDHIGKAAIHQVDAAKAELSQTGNIAKFYDEIRGMTEAYLSNSFNRKLGKDDK